MNSNIDARLYMRIYDLVQAHPSTHQLIIFLNGYTPKLMMLLFYGLMPILVIMHDIRVIPYAVFPLIELVLVTKFRNKIDRPRPFDMLDVTPLENHSSGHSFPSLHCSSSFVITTALFYINPVLGIISLIISIIVAATRLLAGVHYTTDVLAGILIGLVFGVPYLFF